MSNLYFYLPFQKNVGLLNISRLEMRLGREKQRKKHLFALLFALAQLLSNESQEATMLGEDWRAKLSSKAASPIL